MVTMLFWHLRSEATEINPSCVLLFLLLALWSSKVYHTPTIRAQHSTNIVYLAFQRFVLTSIYQK
ncbi:hypothetical protein ES332_D08G145100v1 [Gossypium tomentosum]|uniref:Uncharacterized protein n=1 Tax=Gossypium tomentosum TaxID=34277 RepID=A0A5D2JVB6_GOSTO|nr:hypothetical protein ES332_D08G145100v1 [Gossypium tomentosum]